MKLRRKRSSGAGFLCFNASAIYDDDEEEVKTETSTGSPVKILEEESGSSSRRHPRRTLTKAFRSAAFISALVCFLFEFEFWISDANLFYL